MDFINNGNLEMKLPPSVVVGGVASGGTRINQDAPGGGGAGCWGGCKGEGAKEEWG